LPSPIELYVTYEPHRFITRFNAIQQEVQAQLREMSDEAEAEAESAAVIGVEAEMGEEETYDHPEEVDGRRGERGYRARGRAKSVRARV
jgi:hypothetical protein